LITPEHFGYWFIQRPNSFRRPPVGSDLELIVACQFQKVGNLVK